MKAIDKFYTPPSLAKKMVSIALSEQPKYIADFAVGNGELLKAARERWSKGQFIAVDICKSTVTKLRHIEPDWLVTRCDFLNGTSRNRSHLLANLGGKVSLVFLNPPFTCRGGSYENVLINDTDVRCSTALAFILNSIHFLAADGQIVAILPEGCLNSEKDRIAWTTLNIYGKTEIVGTNGNRTFSGCFARTCIMRFQMIGLKDRGKKTKKKYSQNFQTNNKIRIKVIRGNVQMHSLNGQGLRKSIPLIHTTELKGSKIVLSRLVDTQNEGLCGPMLMLPRVGQPNRTKLMVYSNVKPIVLSDCVIALKCKTISEVYKIKEIFEKEWATVEKAYGGTCAKYITITAVSQLLINFGFQVEVK